MTHNRRISDRHQVPHRPWPRNPTPEEENTRSVGRMLLLVVVIGLALWALLFWAFFSFLGPKELETGSNRAQPTIQAPGALLTDDGPEIVWVCRTDTECEQEERAYMEGKTCSMSLVVLVGVTVVSSYGLLILRSHA